jgi:2-amino-4-hydroxy-6-hydroxymethyldihydropteridine diphosphokinase
MPLAYMILGGNRGNRTEILATAIGLVTSQIGQKIAISGLYESESWGFKSEPFVNQVIAIKTMLSPTEVLKISQQIENQLGRTRTNTGYEARTIDIDLLYYDSLVINTPDLTIPHPRITQRRFVLLPLAEIAADLKDPVTGLTVSEMLRICPDTLEVKRMREQG